MLEQLMRLLEEDGLQQPVELARKLNVSQVLVEEMLSFLIRHGKVIQLPGSSLICTQASCGGCAFSVSCPQLAANTPYPPD